MLGNSLSSVWLRQEQVLEDEVYLRVRLLLVMCNILLSLNAASPDCSIFKLYQDATSNFSQPIEPKGKTTSAVGDQ